MENIKLFNTEYISLDSAETPQHLAELLAELQQGKDIVLIKNGRVAGKIIPSTRKVADSAPRNWGFERIPWHLIDLDRPVVSGPRMAAACGLE